MAINAVKAHVEGIHANAGTIGSETLASLTLYDAAGVSLGAAYVSPDVTAVQLTSLADSKRIKGQRGVTTGLLAFDEGIQIVLPFILQGTDRAKALLSGTVPNLLTPTALAGMPIMPFQSFADALNWTVGSNTYPGIFLGDASIDGKNDDAWTGTITLVRFRGIPTWAAIS